MVRVCSDPGTTHFFASDALRGISVGLAWGVGEPDGCPEAGADEPLDPDVLEEAGALAAGAELPCRVATGVVEPELTGALDVTPDGVDDDAVG